MLYNGHLFANIQQQKGDGTFQCVCSYLPENLSQTSHQTSLLSLAKIVTHVLPQPITGEKNEASIFRLDQSGFTSLVHRLRKMFPEEHGYKEKGRDLRAVSAFYKKEERSNWLWDWQPMVSPKHAETLVENNWTSGR